MKIENAGAAEIERGYKTEPGVYVCLSCDARFEEGEVYPLEKHFYTAERAAAMHVQQEHPQHLQSLLQLDSKYNSLTQNQRRLMQLLATGHSDKEIAAELGLSLSTIRHQRFTFREKAKQARLYLAQYEAVTKAAGAAGAAEADNIIPTHDGARMLDDRYIITEAERAKILQTVFASLKPLRLAHFPAKEKKKLVILTQLAELFSPGVQYTEWEVNNMLEGVYHDYVTLRRYLIEYGFLQRKKDGSLYWRV